MPTLEAAPRQVQIACVTEPAFSENAYLVWRPGMTDCWIIDPGLPPSAGELLAGVRSRELKPAAIVLTHAHADHIAGIPEVLAMFPGLPVFVAAGEAALLADPRENLSAWSGLPFTVDAPNQVDIAPGDRLDLSGTEWQILDVAGHSPAGRALYCPAASLVISGDALFAGSIGRTDFPHGDHDALIRNIRNNLLTLPPETIVHSGHGPATTIGRERDTNPWL